MLGDLRRPHLDHARRYHGKGFPRMALRVSSNGRLLYVFQAGATIDSEVVSVTLPGQNEQVELTTRLDLSGGEFAGWKYEIVE